MGSSTNDDKPLRYACDRCHSQKLRCPRSSEPEKGNPEEPCSRCRKAGVPCVVSLRGKVGRPSKATKKKNSVRSPRSCVTPEADFPSYDVNSVLGGDDNGVAPWASPSVDGLMDMFDLDSGSGSVTTATSPKTMADDVKPEVTSHANGSRPFSDISMGPGYIQMPYEPFVMDFDTEVDYPTFCIPSNLTDMPSSMGFNEGGKTFNPEQLDGLLAMDAEPSISLAQTDLNMSSSTQNGSEMDPTTLDPRMSFGGNPKSPGDVFTSEDFEPLAEFSSTASYQKLSDLNVRILQCSSAAQSGGAATNSAQLLKDVTGFSGELIDTARQSMPHFLDSSRAPSRASTASKGSSLESEDGDRSVDTAFSHSSWGSVNPGSSSGMQSTNHSVPESAVIFLLLGCYTQILHLFEVTTNCLWAQHCESGQPNPPSEDSSGTIGSLLEASIAIHTVTYLLSRLHRALAVPQGDGPGEGSEPQAWKTSFVGGKELEDGLLGRAFGEIREREQWLMRRTQCLQQRINKCHI